MLLHDIYTNVSTFNKLEMKTTKIITIALLLTTLAVGCEREGGYVRIFAESMGGSKVFLNLTDINAATWINGETVNLNGVSRTIASGANVFYLDGVAPLTETMYAVYPATTSTGGNNIVVTNANSSGATITLNSLAVNFHDGGHDIIFPMAATATGGSNQLMFRHLTGGLKLILQAQTTVNVATVKVITYGTAPIGSVTIDGVSHIVRWAVEGPTLPAGEVGGIDGDRDVKYASEMLLNMQTDGNQGVSVTTDGITFCVPVTISDVRRITVIGYASDGTELFSKTKSIAPATSILRNTLYTVPTLNI